MGRALYDYEATADDELTITEDETLLVYDKEEDWSLVKSQTGKGIGFVPTAYIGEVSAAHVLRCCERSALMTIIIRRVRVPKRNQP